MPCLMMAAKEKGATVVSKGLKFRGARHIVVRRNHGAWRPSHLFQGAWWAITIGPLVVYHTPWRMW